MQWETSCVRALHAATKIKSWMTPGVYLSLKVCFGLGFFVIQSVSEFLFWVTLQSPLQVNPAATACLVHSDSTWKTTREMCWMTGMTQLQQEAWEKNQRYFCTLLRIFYFVEPCTFEGNCLLWTIKPISKHTVSSFPYNIQHKPLESPLCV